MSTYPIFPGNGSYATALDPWARLAADRKKQSAGNPAPRRPAAPPAAPPVKPPGMTVQQWADAQAQKLVDEQIKAIQETQAQYNAQLEARARQQAEAAQRFAAMVQGMGIDKQIQGAYKTAGDDIAGYAQGFAGQIRDTAAADAAEQARMVSGTGQEGAVRNEGQGMGDVVYGVGGWIPGKTNAAVGAAMASDAARQPGFMLQQGLAQAQQSYLDASNESGQEFLDKILQAKLGKADISASLAKQRTDQNFAMQKAAQDKLNDDRTYWLKMQAYYQATGKLKLSADAGRRAAASQKRLENNAMGLDVNGNVLPGYTRQPNGQIVKNSDVRADAAARARANKDKGLDVNGNLLPGYARKNGKIVKVGTGSTKTLTPGQKSEILHRVLVKEDDMTKAMPSIAKAAGLDAAMASLAGRMGPPSPAYTKQLNTIKTAIKKELLTRYGAEATTPESKRALRKLIARIVDSYRPSAGGSGLTEGLLP